MHQEISPQIDFSSVETFEECDIKRQSVILNLFSDRKPVCLHFPTTTSTKVYDLKQIIFNRMLIDPEEQQYYTLSGKWLSDSIKVFDSDDVDFVTLNLKLRLLGGKGGFGSMLRAQGGKMASQKTTNFEACRDLNGRRLRTVNEAKRLADHLEQEPERQRVRKEKLLRKIEEGMVEQPTKKIRFDDTEYLKDCEEMKEKIQVAVSQALSKKSNSNANSSNSAVSNSKALSLWDVVESGSDSSEDDASDNSEDDASDDDSGD
ncbi:29031_t:CDS:2 [Gigaspora margarita]|uniref:29030_t:CDS:1 n=1 Tax=Gigaspora margarita TaxID=4874 RepID=A0ABN7V8Y2_GIGMA|nr:29030_t:CDS:2 [Gigaspora margarita]CAG8737942.1 29031_t:CDS:2 [Gigaspora margarita]